MRKKEAKKKTGKINNIQQKIPEKKPDEFLVCFTVRQKA